MPTPQILDFTPKQNDSPIARTLGTFGEEALRISGEKRDTDRLKEIYGKYQQDKSTIDAALLETQTARGLSPTARVQGYNSLMGIKKYNYDASKKADKDLKDKEKSDKKAAEIKAKEDKEKADAAKTQQEVKDIYLTAGDSEEDADIKSKTHSPATARFYAGKKLKPEKPEKQSPFDKAVETAEAKELVELEKAIPKGEDAISNLDYIEKQFNENLTGLTGTTKALLNTGDAAEVENVGFTAIEPIIKLFNPVGPIPVQKVKIIRDAFQPHATDLKSTFRGKVAALRRLAQQGLDRAKKRIEFIRATNGKPDKKQLAQFDQESGQIEDALILEEKQKLYGSQAQQSQQQSQPRQDGKIKVRNKQTGQTGWVTLGQDTEAKYELL